MSVAARRVREKKEMRTVILQVARDIAARDGWQNLTIRKICDEIHYTAPVIYQYFESKEMILISLRMQGLILVYNNFEELNKKYSDPSKRLLEYGLSFWQFAETNPELYQVMFNLQGVICAEEEKHRAIENIRRFYAEAINAINEKARRSEKVRWELFDHFSAIIHGLIAMRMVNKMKSGSENGKTVLKNALQRFINSINTTTCPKEK